MDKISKVSLSKIALIIYLFLACFLVYWAIQFRNSPLEATQHFDYLMVVTSGICLIGMIIASTKSGVGGWYIHTGWAVLLVAFVFLFAENITSSFSVFQNFEPIHHYLYLLSYSLITVGIFFLPSSPRPTTRRKKQFIDIIVFALISLAAIWVVILFSVITGRTVPFDQAYIALDYLMVFAVLDFLLRRRHSAFQTTSYFVALGVATIILGDLLLLISQNGYILWLNIAGYASWLVSDAAFCLAAVRLEFTQDLQQTSIKGEIAKPEKYQELIVPVVWVGLVYMLLIWSHYNPEVLSFPILAAGTGGLIVMLIIRLVEALKENAKLIDEAHEEIRSRATLQERFWHDSRHDHLTSLPNRAYLIDQLSKRIEMTQESGQITSCLFFLDLDRFKTINDNLGHSIGDEFLKTVAERLVFCVRPDDFVARLGGDEFAILLNNLQSSRIVEKICDRILQKMDEPFEVHGIAIQTGISFGIAYILPDHTSPEDIIRKADVAMYKAKNKGRGRFEISENVVF
jgi:diguanylate cyclase (GGDEF)-like protein